MSGAARKPRILGLDISLTKTGAATASGTTYTIKGGKGDERLNTLFREVSQLAHDHHLAIIEDLPTHAMSAGLTGQAQGVARLALWRARVPYVTVPPSVLKKWATGKGNAKKPEMIKAALEVAGGVDPKVWTPTDDEADAYLLRELGEMVVHLGVPKDVKVDWTPWEGWL